MPPQQNFTVDGPSVVRPMTAWDRQYVANGGWDDLERYGIAFCALADRMTAVANAHAWEECLERLQELQWDSVHRYTNLVAQEMENHSEGVVVRQTVDTMRSELSESLDMVTGGEQPPDQATRDQVAARLRELAKSLRKLYDAHAATRKT